ncbi:MAG: ABC transporter permease, partial [Planctomycetaceae bacterium]
MTPPDALADARDAPTRTEPGAPNRPQHPPRGPVATARKYYKIFRASLVERLAYRGDFLLGTLLRFLPMVTTILLWQA